MTADLFQAIATQTGGGMIVLLALIMVLSVVQGLFGVGLLVFGTPTLLLLGFPFQEALACLLPSSVLISALQLWQGKGRVELHRSLPWALPPLFLGLTLVLSGTVSVDMKFMLGLLMVLSVLVRLCAPLKERFQKFLNRSTGGYMALMGFVHGISNMGGALLTILAASRYQQKDDIRANIACCYLVFGMSQLALLALFHPEMFSIMTVALAATSAATYGTLVQLVYLKTSESRYQGLITLVTLCYGLVLLGHRIIS